MIRVVIIDDSSVARQMLRHELSGDELISVVGTAADAIQGRNAIVELNPDVVILDVQMPRVDGLTFLSKLMTYYPKPVIVVSSFARDHAPVAVEALRLGAVDVIAKPSAEYSLTDMGVDLREKIKAAAAIDINAFVENIWAERRKGPRHLSLTNLKSYEPVRTVLVGSGTGSIAHLEHLLSELPANGPATLIVQHMPAGSTRVLAERLDSACAIKVKEAEDGEPVRPGVAYIAPGDFHMMVSRTGGGVVIKVKRGPLVSRNRPAIDLLFNSAAHVFHAGLVGVLLNGCGKDGLHGVGVIQEHGGAGVVLSSGSRISPEHKYLERLSMSLLPQRVIELSKEVPVTGEEASLLQ